ncbi:hypothetical protein SUNI508_12927 [Seiridium unicorne]|uniref:RRM domain-containing protein n=1 Tax=Seiridium unicorne TaxID=138068 RepID=A0ABR2VF44_9PEZI
MVEHKTFLTTHNKLKDHRRASAAFRVLWVGNLDYMTTQEEATRHLEEKGLDECWVYWKDDHHRANNINPGWFFVKFRNEANTRQALALLSNTKIRNRSLVARFNTPTVASTNTNYAPGVAAETTSGATSSPAQATFGDAAMAMATASSIGARAPVFSTISRPSQSTMSTIILERVEGYDMDLWKMPQRPGHYWTGLDNRDYDRIEDGRDTMKPEPDTGRFFLHEIESKERGDFQPTWTPQGNIRPNLSLYTQPHLPSDMESKEEHPTQSHGRDRGHSI